MHCRNAPFCSAPPTRALQHLCSSTERLPPSLPRFAEIYPTPGCKHNLSRREGNKFKFYFLSSAWLSSGGASASWAIPSAWVWKPAGLFFKMPWKFALYGFLTPSLHGWGEGCFLDSFLTVPGKQLQPGRILNQSSTPTAALHSLSLLASRSSVLFQSHLATHIMSTVPGILCLFSLLGLLVPLGGALASIRFTDILVFYVVSKCITLLHPSLYTKIIPECLSSFSNMCV